MGRATDIDARIGRNMRTLRALRGITQDLLAASMEERGHRTWVRATVSEVERGLRGVLVSEAFALADCLEVALSQLLSEQLIENR